MRSIGTALASHAGRQLPFHLISVDNVDCTSVPIHPDKVLLHGGTPQPPRRSCWVDARKVSQVVFSRIGPGIRRQPRSSATTRCISHADRPHRAPGLPTSPTASPTRPWRWARPPQGGRRVSAGFAPSPRPAKVALTSWRSRAARRARG